MARRSFWSSSTSRSMGQLALTLVSTAWREGGAPASRRAFMTWSSRSPTTPQKMSTRSPGGVVFRSSVRGAAGGGP